MHDVKAARFGQDKEQTKETNEKQSAASEDRAFCRAVPCTSLKMQRTDIKLFGTENENDKTQNVQQQCQRQQERQRPPVDWKLPQLLLALAPA